MIETVTVPPRSKNETCEPLYMPISLPVKFREICLDKFMAEKLDPRIIIINAANTKSFGGLNYGR